MTRTELENTAFELIYDMDCIGREKEIREELATMTSEELEKAIDNYKEDQ